jgi:hypothetical protein
MTSAVAASAGNKDSIASSDSVMSSGVKKHRRGAEERQHARRRVELQWYDHPGEFARPSGIAAFEPRRISPQFDQEIGEHAIGRYFDLAVQAGEDVLTPLRQVDDPWRKPGRVQAQSQHIDGWLQ